MTTRTSTGLAWGLAIAALALASLLHGCGSAQSTANGIDETLNAITDVADPAYELAVRTCDRVEGEIIDRFDAEEGDQAAQAMRVVRFTCDGMIEAFEAVREAQAAARRVADQFRAGEVTETELVEASAATARAAARAKAAYDAFVAATSREATDPPDPPEED